MADIVSMTDYSAWKLPGSAILFLIGCAWHNRRGGQRKMAIPDSTEFPQDASPIWKSQPEPLKLTVSDSEQTQQLVNLNLALQSQKEEANQEKSRMLPMKPFVPGLSS